MRRKVPFLGEERIARAGDEDADAKKNRGHLIDDVLSTQKQPSTWDDLVTDDYPDPINPPPKAPRAHAPAPSPVNKQRPKKLPVNPGKGLKFNLTEAPTLTLTGLGMLLLFKEQKGSERGDIKLCHCNKDVWQLLQWTGMDKYFTIQGGPGQG